MPGTLSEAADSRDALKGTLNGRAALVQRILDRMRPSAERALLPTGRGKDDERPLVPKALLIYPDIRSMATQRSFTQPPRALTLRQRDPQGRAEARRGSAGPTNGTWSAAVKSYAAGSFRYGRRL